MRITTEKLLDLALKEAESRSGVVSGYVIGSTARGDPVLGGTADIDLVLIHEYEPISTREIVPLSSDVHLDIAHHAKRMYDQPRDLRIDPWLGPAMCEPVFLHDPTHFFEWAQASVRGQFYRSDYVHARSKVFLERARKSLSNLDVDRLWLHDWLHALMETTNAVAGLDGFPASGRMVMFQLKTKLLELEQQEVFDRFLTLLGTEAFETDMAEDWIEAWAEDFESASELSAHPELGESRKNYYLGGFQSTIENGSAVDILWPLLTTWDRAVHVLGAAGSKSAHWKDVLHTLRMSREHAPERETDLENMMDEVEEVLELWAETVGA